MDLIRALGRSASVISGRQLNQISSLANGILSNRNFVPALGMPNVGSLIPPERILSNICCMVADSLKGAADKDEFQVTWHVFRIYSSSRHKLFTDVGRERVQLLVTEFEGLRERAIAFRKGSYAIAEDP
jgi:hypothetical protein